jgi:hypothetical protein
MTHIATPAPASMPNMKTTTPMVIFAGRLGHSGSRGGAILLGAELVTIRVLDCTKYGANESSFVMAEQTSTLLVRDISRRQWGRRRFRRRLRSVVGAVRDGECLGVAMSPNGA